MTPAELNEALRAAGIPKRRGEQLLGIQERRLQKMTAGTARIPAVLVKLVRLVERYGVRVEELREL